MTTEIETKIKSKLLREHIGKQVIVKPWSQHFHEKQTLAPEFKYGELHSIDIRSNCSIYCLGGLGTTHFNVNDLLLELTSLSDITNEHAIEVAKLMQSADRINFKVSKGYFKDGILNIPKDVVCIESSWYCAHPDIQKELPSSLIQIDTEYCDIIAGHFIEQGAQYEDAIPENLNHAYDFLRECGYALPVTIVSSEKPVIHTVKDMV